MTLTTPLVGMFVISGLVLATFSKFAKFEDSSFTCITNMKENTI